MYLFTGPKLYLFIMLAVQCVASVFVSGHVVTLTLGSTPLANNSAVVITDIGDVTDDTPPLICTTTFRPCCAHPAYRHGEWFYPNETLVPNNAAGQNFSRGRSDVGEVFLNRRNNAMSPLGTYYCELPQTNSYDYQRLTVRVVLALPRAPSSPTIESTTPQSTSITITWTQPKGDVVDNYEITYSYQGPCSGVAIIEPVTITTNGTVREYTVTELEEFSDYQITITAVNSAGKSVASSITAKTYSTAPSGPPQSLIVSSITISNITIQWDPVECLDRNGDISLYRVRYGPTLTTERMTATTNVNTRMFTINGLSPQTSYSFEVEALNIHHFFVGPAVSITATPHHDRVGFLLNGILYDNNSIVTLDEIGEGSAALFCLTNNTDCCRSSDTPQNVGAVGEWFFPNGSSARNAGSGDAIFRGRGPSFVRLQHRNNAQTTGVFRCEVPDASGTNQQLYVGVYPVNSGSPSITGAGLVYNPSTLTLTCTSTGGPATTVTWRKNGVVVEVDRTTYHQSQRVVDTRTATYENTLTSSDVANFVGNFICRVSNYRGNGYGSIFLAGVTIHHDPFNIGMSTTLTCTTDVSVDEIEWLDSERRVVTMTTSTDQLDLTFNPVNDSIHNSVYTCRVTRGGAVNEDSTTIEVTVPDNAITATSSASGSAAVVGESYTLTCTIITLPGMVNTPTATWTYPNGSVTPSTPNTSVITFNPLKTSHAGQYICRGSVTSPASQGNPLMDMTPLSISVQIPTPHVTLRLNNSGLLYAGTTSVTLTCTITLSDDVDTDVMMEVTWFRSGTSLSNTTSRVTISPLAESERTFTSNLTLSPLYPEDNTTFTCRVVAQPSPRSSFVVASDETMSTVDLVLQLQLIFRGVSYPNNSVLSLNDIGDTSTGSAILCTTNRRPCCTSPHFGEWYYPNGSVVPNNAAGEDFFRGRRDNQTIILSRRNNAQSPGGLFCCKLPDNSDVIQTICVTIVSISLTPSGNNTAGEHYQLNCTVQSTDSPTFLWTGLPNDSPLPSDTRMVSDVMSSGSTHISTLQFNPLQSSHEGSYTCQVTVGTVTEMRSIQVNVEAPVITAMVSGGIPTVGESYSLTCTVTGAGRLNPTITYQWFKDNTVVSDETQSTLSFSSLSLSDAGRYRCDVTVSSTLLSQSVRETSTNYLNLQIPPPRVTVTASPDNSIGTRSSSSLTLTCSIELSEAVDIAVTVNTVWSGPSDGTQFNSIATQASALTYISTASFSSSVSSDSGAYTCRVTVSSPSSPFVHTSNETVGTKRVKDVLQRFQLKMRRTDDCITWNANKAKEIRSYIFDELLGAITSRCQCEVPKENLLNGVFSCLDSHDQTTYRSTIIGTQSYTATQLEGYLQDWVTSDPTLTIQWYTVKLDQMCPVSISSLGEPECGESE